MRWPWQKRPRHDLDTITEDATRRLEAARKTSNGGLRSETIAAQKAMSDQLERQNRIAGLIREGFRI